MGCGKISRRNLQPQNSGALSKNTGTNIKVTSSALVLSCSFFCHSQNICQAWLTSAANNSAPPKVNFQFALWRICHYSLTCEMYLPFNTLSFHSWVSLIFELGLGIFGSSHLFII